MKLPMQADKLRFQVDRLRNQAGKLRNQAGRLRLRADKLRIQAGKLLLLLDLAGTALFAIEGASIGIRAHLDLLGVLVFSFLSAAGGGILRDLLIGAHPPAAIRNWRYPATAFVAGGGTFALHRFVANFNPWIITALNAAGRAFYSVAGALKALEFGMNPLAAVIMAAVTGSGGGVIRDVLMVQVPSVLSTDFNASSSMIGGLVTVLALQMRQSTRIATWAGIISCFVVRMAAAYFHWHLPKL